MEQQKKENKAEGDEMLPERRTSDDINGDTTENHAEKLSVIHGDASITNDTFPNDPNLLIHPKSNPDESSAETTASAPAVLHQNQNEFGTIRVNVRYRKKGTVGKRKYMDSSRNISKDVDDDSNPKEIYASKRYSTMLENLAQYCQRENRTLGRGQIIIGEGREHLRGTGIENFDSDVPAHPSNRMDRSYTEQVYASKELDYDPSNAMSSVPGVPKKVMRERDLIQNHALQELLEHNISGRDLDEFIVNRLGVEQSRAWAKAPDKSTRQPTLHKMYISPVHGRNKTHESLPSRTPSQIHRHTQSCPTGAPDNEQEAENIDASTGGPEQEYSELEEGISSIHTQGIELKDVSEVTGTFGDRRRFKNITRQKFTSKWTDLASETSSLTMQDRIAYAATYVEDSVLRDETINRKRWARNVYLFVTSKLWKGIHSLFLLAHLGLAWAEPSSFRTYSSTTTNYIFVLLCIEFACLIAHWMDLIMNFLQMGPSFFFSNGWKKSMLAILIIITVDVVFAFTMPIGVRFSRVLRPLLVLGRSHSLRNTSEAILGTVPALRDLVLFLLFLVLFYSVIGIQMFNGLYAGNSDSFAPTFENFDHIGNAALAMFVLLTTENYPGIMYPSLTHSPIFYIFFISFLLFGVYFLLTVVVAVVFHTYKIIRRKSVVLDKVKERRALHLAFQYIDFEQNGLIPFDIFHRLIRIVDDTREEWELRMLFHICDEDKDGRLNIYEFFQICDALLLRFITQSELPAVMTGLPGCFERYFHSDLFDDMVNSKSFERVVITVVFIHFIVLSLFGIPGTSRFVLHSLNLGIACFYFVEQIAVLYGRGIAFFEDSWRIFDLLIVLITFVIHIILLSIGEEFEVTTLLGRVLQGLSALPLIRLISFTKRFRELVFTLLRVLPAVVSMLIVIFVLFYIFSIIGMEWFANSIRNTGPFGFFDNMNASFTILFQLLTLSNWHEVMYTTLKSAGWPAAIYFVCYIALVVLVFLNLLMALIIDLFVAMKEILSADKTIIEIEDPTYEGSFLNAQKKKLIIEKGKRIGQEDIPEAFQKSALMQRVIETGNGDRDGFVDTVPIESLSIDQEERRGSILDAGTEAVGAVLVAEYGGDEPERPQKKEKDLRQFAILHRHKAEHGGDAIEDSPRKSSRTSISQIQNMFVSEKEEEEEKEKEEKEEKEEEEEEEEENHAQVTLETVVKVEAEQEEDKKEEMGQAKKEEDIKKDEVKEEDIKKQAWKEAIEVKKKGPPRPGSLRNIACRQCGSRNTRMKDTAGGKERKQRWCCDDCHLIWRVEKTE